MRNKIIQYLQEEKTVINVKSEEEWIELMEYFEFYNIEWIGSDKAISYVDFKRFGERTSISLGLREDERIGYGDTNYYMQELNYSIILFKKFKKEFIDKDLNYQLHLAKKHIEALEKQLRGETKKYYARFKLKENDLNYLKYDKNEETYGIASSWENQNHKSEFTQKELEDLNVWDNPLFQIEEVEG